AHLHVPSFPTRRSSDLFTADDGTRYELFGSGGGQMLAEEVGVDLMARIPLLPAMGRGADEGEPVAVVAPGSEAAEAFDGLADARSEEHTSELQSRENLV